jgi:hypothetical protein
LDTKLGGISINGDQSLQLFVNISDERGRKYLGDLIHEESLEWGLAAARGGGRGGAHGEERGTEERNEDRREKACSRTIMQSRASASLTLYSSTRTPGWLATF